MDKRKALILGASSDVALALARKLANSGFFVMLAARNTSQVENILSIKGPHESYQVVPFDALDFKSHPAWFAQLPFVPDVTVCVFGYLGSQSRAESDWSESHAIINANYTGAVSILNVVSSEYVKRKAGTIAGFSSVAGERGRQSNYIYGSAKAGFTAYLSGLRNRLSPHGVHVLTIKPGYMATKMTAGMKLPKALTATADRAASRVLNAILNKKNVVYVLPIWYWIMLVIKLVPEFIFKRLRL